MYRYRNYARLIKFNFARKLSAVNLVGYKMVLQVNCLLHRLSGQDFVKQLI